MSGKLAESYFYRGDLYVKQQNYKLAIADCKKAKEMTSETQDLQVYSKACNCLYIAFKETGNHEESLENYEQYVDARETIFNEKT